MRILVLCVLCLAVTETLAQGSSTWNCETLTPNLQSLRHKPPSPMDTSPFRISVTSNTVQAGQELGVQVSVVPPGEITMFIIQARQVGSSVPQGEWSIPSTNEHAKTIQCKDHEADTATNSRLFSVQGHSLTWRAPDNVPEGYKVQLVGASVDGSVGEYWTLHGNTVVEITVTTATVVGEDDEESDTGGNEGGDENTEGEIDPQVTPLDAEDEHDLLLETAMEQDYLQKKQADIAMENLNSETDNTLEENKKRHEEEYKWEMEDYEKRLYEEEIRRQARIDAELRDKEEWEAEQFAEQQRREEEEQRRKQERWDRLGNTLQEVEINDGDKPAGKTGGGCRQTSTFALYTCFVIILAYLL